jgi:heme/copper-type cytochrome/quinol oxidase subunit 2
MQSLKSVEFYIMNKIFTVFVGIMMRISIIVGVVLGWFLGCVILLLQTSLIS